MQTTRLLAFQRKASSHRFFPHTNPSVQSSFQKGVPNTMLNFYRVSLHVGRERSIVYSSLTNNVRFEHSCFAWDRTVRVSFPVRLWSLKNSRFEKEVPCGNVLY